MKSPNSMTSDRVETAAQAAAIIRAELPKVQKEERVFVLPLDANGKMLAKPILVSVGHQDGTTAIDAGAIFREALAARAEEIIVAHNHPSGDPAPSRADIAATKELSKAGELLGVPLVDHLIIGDSAADDGVGFVSIAELQGDLPSARTKLEMTGKEKTK